MLVDSHTHLDSNEFKQDYDKVIVNSGLDYILNIATDLNSLKLSIDLAEQYENIYLGAGIHPHNADKIEFKQFIKFLNHPKIKAIGEIGLDFYRDIAPRAKQEDLFRKFLCEADTRGLPVIIHQRNAYKEVLDILGDFSVRGVMHCFSGDSCYVKECIKLGFYISFAGNITYPGAIKLREAAKTVPLDKLLIETDCPWLAPQPVRGKRNEPANVKYVAEQLAQIKNVSYEEIGRITTENFKTVFKI